MIGGNIMYLLIDSKDASTGELHDCSRNSDRNGHSFIS